MDLLLSTLLAEVLFFFLYLPYASFYWPVFALILYGVLWYYVDDSERTGQRTWHWLRNWRVWRTQFTAVNYVFGNLELPERLQKEKRVVFVVLKGNMTNMALVSGFGFHGGMLANTDIAYLLPSLFFRVPGIREVLLWSGAMAYDASAENLNDRLLTILNKQKSVCFALNGMKEVLRDKHDEGERAISKELFEFACQEKIQFVPVGVEGEDKRYAIYRTSAQAYFMQILGYPCPFLFGPRIFGAEPPPKVDLVFGDLTDPNKYDNVDHFNKWFFSTVDTSSHDSLI